MGKVSAKDVNREVGLYLEAVREALGQSQEAFATSLGLSPNRYNQYERGKRTLAPDIARRIRTQWGISLDYLYSGEIRRLEHDLAEKVKAKIIPPDEPVNGMKIVPVPKRRRRSA